MNPVYLRLIEIAREQGQKDAEIPNRFFEKLLDLSSGRISQIAKPDSVDKIGTDALARLAVLGYNPSWVNDGKLPKKLFDSGFETNVLTHHLDDPLPDHIVLVPEYKVLFGAGGGVINYEIEEGTQKLYEYSWFAKEHMNPKHVRRFKVKNDSMEPTIYSGDSVLVNMEENDISQVIDGRIYAIRYGDELKIKRLIKKLDGSLTLYSDNKEIYKPEDLSPEMVQEHITIIGRVRDKSGKGGL